MAVHMSNKSFIQYRITHSDFSVNSSIYVECHHLTRHETSHSFYYMVHTLYITTHS